MGRQVVVFASRDSASHLTSQLYSCSVLEPCTKKLEKWDKL